MLTISNLFFLYQKCLDRESAVPSVLFYQSTLRDNTIHLFLVCDLKTKNNNTF